MTSEQNIKIAIERIDALVVMHDNPSQAVLFAYLAGIIDGEGTIRINRIRIKSHWNYTYNVVVSVGMVSKEIPFLLRDTFGGAVREERVADRRSIWRWGLNGRLQIYAALKILGIYLRVKKEHADLAIEFCEKFKNPRRHHFLWIVDDQQLRWREETYQKMRKLNAVGAGATTERVGVREGEATV